MPAVFNLTGTVIHTNLGRALLADEAIDAVVAAMRGYVALEYDVESGGRGDRDDIVDELLRELTGAEAATVVNNNAAAVLLTLKALARETRGADFARRTDRDRGRVPDARHHEGGRLQAGRGRHHEPHARARLRRRDRAENRLVLKAHTSNYAMTGFTAAVDDATRQHRPREDIPSCVDLGSGALIDLARYGLPKEPRPQESLAAGADVVTFSGDKLLGGPQAGLIVGRRDLIARIKKDPLKRALRISKLTMAALEATLRIYASVRRPEERLPTLALLTRRQPKSARRASELQVH